MSRFTDAEINLASRSYSIDVTVEPDKVAIQLVGDGVGMHMAQNVRRMAAELAALIDINWAPE